MFFTAFSLLLNCSKKGRGKDLPAAFPRLVGNASDEGFEFPDFQ